MELTDKQLISLQKLYKEELGMEITKTEALAQGLAILRFLELSIIPAPTDNSEST
jgi:hypothetical protein